MLLYTQITGTFQDSQGNPLSGTAEFAVNTTVYAAGIPVLQPDVPVTGEIVNGTLKNLSGGTFQLLATDQGGLTYEGQTSFAFYTVTVTLAGQVLAPWSFFLPHAPSPVDLFSLANTGPGPAGILPPAGDIGGTATAPTVAKIQGTPIGAPPGGSTEFLRGDGTWAVPPGAVASVFGRAGAVTAQSGDYTAAQVGALPSSDDLSAIAGANATAGSVPMNGHKFTGLGAGSASGDSVAYGQLGSAAFEPSGAFDAAGAAAAAQANAIAASLPTLAQAGASASGTLATGTVTEVTAATALTMTLPSPVTGALIVVERAAASTANVAVTGNIRGVAAQTITLQLASESEMFFAYAGSWWPIAGHKTLGSLDTRYLAANAAYTAGNVLASPASIDICQAYGVTPGSDVTAAIQNAMIALAAAGTGGDVVISIPGTYTVNGALQSATVLGYTYNGQILVPAVSASDTTGLAITIRGAVAPGWPGEERPVGGGVTLVSNATGGWVFDAIPANTAFSAPQPWTNVTLAFEDVTIELPSNPQCGIANALCCLSIRGRRLYGVTSFDGAQTLTGTNEAIVIPGFESEGMNVFEQCGFRNLPIAFRFGEHMLLDYVSVYFANIVFNATSTNTGHGLFFNELDVENCAVIFNATTDLSSNPVRVYGSMDYEYNSVQMTAFVNQPNPNGNNGSFIGSVKVHSVTGGSFPMSLGTAGASNLLGRLEIVNVGGYRDQSWKGIHPQDNFSRIYSPMTSLGMANPTFHPWSLQEGTFTVTSGTGLKSTSSGNSIALAPTKENGVSRLTSATFVLPSSGFNVALIAGWCRGGTNVNNWIGAHIHGGGVIDLVTGNGTSLTTLISSAATVTVPATVTIGIEVICNALGVPVWVALYVNGVQKATYGLTAAQSAALNFQTGNGSPPYPVGGFATTLDGLLFLADQVTAVTWFGAQDAVAPMPSVASGTVTLAAGTVTVANTEITSGSIIRLNRQAAGGTLGQLSVALSAGTSFTVNSSSGTDTSTVYYEIVSY
jgi:hypothetical protein